MATKKQREEAFFRALAPPIRPPRYKNAKRKEIREKIYRELVKKGGEKCWICEREPPKVKLCIDHCHDTKKIRGLLCVSCNTKLGWLERNLTCIVDYLDV